MKTVRRRTRVSNPGEYRHYGAVRVKTEVDDDRLGSEPSWATSFSAFFKIKPLSSHEQLIADQLKQKISHNLFTPYRETWQADFINSRRIKFDTRIFQIKSVVVIDEVNQEVLIRCEEKV